MCRCLPLQHGRLWAAYRKWMLGVTSRKGAYVRRSGSIS